MFIPDCSLIKDAASVVFGSAQETVWILKGSYELIVRTPKLINQIRTFSFEIVRALMKWAETHDDLETIDSMASCYGEETRREKDGHVTANELKLFTHTNTLLRINIYHCLQIST
ncbi:MAG: hypothetical protein ACPGYT_01715 [Nitrospirales bacterium]